MFSKFHNLLFSPLRVTPGISSDDVSMSKKVLLLWDMVLLQLDKNSTEGASCDRFCRRVLTVFFVFQSNCQDFFHVMFLQFFVCLLQQTFYCLLTANLSLMRFFAAYIKGGGAAFA